MSSYRDEINHLLQSLLVLFLLLNVGPAYTQVPFICLDTTQRLLLREDTLAVNAGFITGTRDGNFLIPGYFYPNRGMFYNMPYLIKSTPGGDILWSKRYYSSGAYPGNWFAAGRIKELNNGDMLMTGQIGVPGTDNRRELAVWKLDKNGIVLWGLSYESALWTNPITGSSEITGILEDAAGNIFLCGNQRIFGVSMFAFVLKLDAKGNVLWDKNYSSYNGLAYGILFLQNKLLLIGSLGNFLPGSSQDTNVLWCLNLDTGSGDILGTKAWYADFGKQSFMNSFAYANTSVCIPDNGQISVFGTANSDFAALSVLNPDTITHSIIANFSPDFDFLSGIMLRSVHPTNYYNTVATQHANGRISYTRFVENNNLFNEDIIYGSIQNNRVIKERIYHEQNRSGAFVSNFLFSPPDHYNLVQTFWDESTGHGGLEMLRLGDKDNSNPCNGKDTSMTLIQPYFMKQGQVTFDSIVANTFRQTYHNFVNDIAGSMIKSTGCMQAGKNLYGTPVVSLDKDSVLCTGSDRQLTAGQGYSRYLWNNGNTSSSISVSDTGRYWVTVTSLSGCKGSDTTYIATFASLPSAFLPDDTTICQFTKLTLQAGRTYQRYLWSDLSTTSTLTVSKPGLYRLEVTDSNHCVGLDSIRLTQKNCLVGLFVPNAFTPNDDGRDDVFRPLFFGNLVGFNFAVYNRWGKKVFETRVAGQGWNGKLNGIPAATGEYAWYCRYQMDGQPQKSNKGIVLLMR